MMCIACQQDFMWLAYLESRGLIGPDKAAAAGKPFAAVADEPPSISADESAPEPAGNNKFSCDDPTAE
jgi:hypothetical protein